MKTYFVYILTNRRNGTLYIGVTNDLKRRCEEHMQGCIDGFTKKYGINSLAWYETTPDIYTAILREKRLKKWNRSWKLKLIEGINPDWRDLALEL